MFVPDGLLPMDPKPGKNGADPVSREHWKLAVAQMRWRLSSQVIPRPSSNAGAGPFFPEIDWEGRAKVSVSEDVTESVRFRHASFAHLPRDGLSPGGSLKEIYRLQTFSLDRD
ncbi:thioredoxin reductase [Anopheles sinensis]|uniref:Thioredoxin reductase n=1 Tax=Anopheles sinensis TaxID=74873 RepID=A0A084VLV8_ANOSI|nr:thioredoxin reductase [Anopheles sinensis]